jgi:hypothetical protein
LEYLFFLKGWNWLGQFDLADLLAGRLLALVIALGSGLALVLWRRAIRTDSSHPTSDLSVPR